MKAILEMHFAPLSWSKNWSILGSKYLDLSCHCAPGVIVHTHALEFILFLHQENAQCPWWRTLTIEALIDVVNKIVSTLVASATLSLCIGLLMDLVPKMTSIQWDKACSSSKPSSALFEKTYLSSYNNCCNDRALISYFKLFEDILN